MICGNKKGQGLIELATFGTVLLFMLSVMMRLAMGANYRQTSLMNCFRHAFVRASSRYPDIRGGFNPGWDFENEAESGYPIPLPGNRYRNVSWCYLADKPLYSASGVLPVPERIITGVTMGAVRSIDMYASMVYGDEEHLPRTEFEINNRRYCFTTADYKEYAEHPNMQKKENKEDWDGNGPYWEWVTVDSAEQYDYVDVDLDNYEELVLEKSGTTLKCVDFEEGEINPHKPLVDGAKDRGGLEEDFDKDLIIQNTNLNKRESPSTITTIDSMNINETINRTITTRGDTYEGGTYFVESQIRTQGDSTWTTPFE